MKGPYAMDDKKFKLNINNTRALQILEDRLPLSNNEQSYLPWDAIIETTDKTKTEYYLVQQNVGTSEYTEMTVEAIGEGSLNKGNCIVSPGSHIKTVQTLADIKYGGDPENITPELAKASLQYLYFRYILGVGDVNLRNILVRNDNIDHHGELDLDAKIVAGVDMEEMPTNSPEGDTIDLLLPKKTQKPILDKLTPQLDTVKYFDASLSPEIKDVLKTDAYLTDDEIEAINLRIQKYKDSVTK